MAKRGRKRKDGPRGKDGRLLRESGKFTPPPDHILERRKLFSFVTPAKGPDGRVGEIDQDICDGIGMLHALGLLDNHGFDATELRDIGREWRNGYVAALKPMACKTGSYERQSKGVTRSEYTAKDEKWDRLNDSLSGIEKMALLTLLVDPEVGTWLDRGETPWVQAIVGEALLERKKLPPPPYVFPTMMDREMLKAAVRGLLQLMDASLPSRREQMLGRAA